MRELKCLFRHALFWTFSFSWFFQTEQRERKIFSYRLNVASMKCFESIRFYAADISNWKYVIKKVWLFKKLLLFFWKFFDRFVEFLKCVFNFNHVWINLMTNFDSKLNLICICAVTQLWNISSSMSYNYLTESDRSFAFFKRFMYLNSLVLWLFIIKIFDFEIVVSFVLCENKSRKIPQTPKSF